MDSIITSQVISFGYRCTSAGILKKMGFKHESFPFDWLISRLSVIQHCIEDDFCEFLNIENYDKRHTNTYEMMDKKTGFICDEHILFNTFYQPPNKMNEENTYCYHLAMNHHNIFQLTDRQYYMRCIDRFRQVLNAPEKRIYLHISPLMDSTTFIENQDSVMNECFQFSQFIKTKTNGYWSGIFFIMVKTDGPFSYTLVEDEDPHSYTRFYILHVNPRLKDAGEIFYGEYSEEYDFIRSVIYSYHILL